LGLVEFGCTGLVPAATLATACGVAVDDGRGTDVLGLFWARAVEELLPQPQLFMLIQEGVVQPPTLLPERHPLAALIDRQKPKAPTIVHREIINREIATRMAGNPSLVQATLVAGKFLPG
jgi:hypothetical protein